jgi:hypothetical protein
VSTTAELRCAVRSRALGEQMLGTAFPAARVLLVEQPGGWGLSGLPSSKFDPAVAAELTARYGRKGIRVLAIRRPGRHTDEVTSTRHWGFADSRAGRRSIVWGEFETDAELLELQLDQAGAGDTTPCYFVCAHGTHDACCAVEGRPVAAALQTVAPQATWECSHLGGDRFAANVLVLPAGIVYGRVQAAQAADLVRATERDEVLVPNLRGQIGMAPIVQAGLVLARQALDRAALDDLWPLDMRPVGEQDPADTFEVELRSGTEIVTATVHTARQSPKLQTCRAERPVFAMSYTLTALVTGPAPAQSIRDE